MTDGVVVTRLFFVLLFTLAAALWDGASAQAAPLAEEEEILVIIRGRQFLPDTVTVHAGRKTKLVFQNQDAELHVFMPFTLFSGVNLNISGNGAPEFGDDGFRRIIIPPDGHAELRFVLDRPSHFPFICDMPGHEMRATLVVE
ncbi:MAG: cupredoxin domain-containing protein [Nitrospira sp.]